VRPASSDGLLAMLKGRAGTPRHVESIRLKPLQPGSRASTPRLDLRPHGQLRDVLLPTKNHVLGRIETDQAAVGALRTILNPDPCRYDDFGNVGFWHGADVERTSAEDGNTRRPERHTCAKPISGSASLLWARLAMAFSVLPRRSTPCLCRPSRTRLPSSRCASRVVSVREIPIGAAPPHGRMRVPSFGAVSIGSWSIV